MRAASAGASGPSPASHETANAAAPGDVGDDLALRAALDPAWDAVLAVYLAGLARWPDPFQPRKPKPRT